MKNTVTIKSQFTIPNDGMCERTREYAIERVQDGIVEEARKLIPTLTESDEQRLRSKIITTTFDTSEGEFLPDPENGGPEGKDFDFWRSLFMAQTSMVEGRVNLEY